MRSLPILVPAAVVLGRACPLASIRQVRTWRLTLVERDAAEPVTGRPAGWDEELDADARPRADRPQHEPDSGAERWPVNLAGDGFRAFWWASSPVRGPVRVRGDLVVDPFDGRPTTGRILRVRVVTETLAVDDHGATRVVALRGRDRSAIPKTLDGHGLDGTSLVRDRGVLLDLELDEA